MASEDQLKDVNPNNYIARYGVNKNPATKRKTYYPILVSVVPGEPMASFEDLPFKTATDAKEKAVEILNNARLAYNNYILHMMEVAAANEKALSEPA